MRFLGVDPGLRLTGYAVLDCAPPHSPERPRLIEAGVLRLPINKPIPHRLVELESDLEDVLSRLVPDPADAAAAVESLFSHYKRPTTAVAMAHARGVILLALRRHGLNIRELRPTRVKKSLTGFGHATKRQMQLAVASQLGLAEPPSPSDVADAIAVALCAARAPRTTASPA